MENWAEPGARIELQGTGGCRDRTLRLGACRLYQQGIQAAARSIGLATTRPARESNLGR